MNAKQVDATLRAGMNRHEERQYLGMSNAGGCPRAAYWSMVDPKPPDRALTWYGFTGYGHEAMVKALLGAKVDAVQTLLDFSDSKIREFVGSNIYLASKEIIADFDPRYRGHLDLPMADMFVEIKSVGFKKWVFLVEQENGAKRNLAQVQAYMRHGGYDRCVLVYVARDVPHWDLYKSINGVYPPFFCLNVYPEPSWQDQLDEKAKMILAAVDTEEPPECTCRYCKR